MAEKSAKRGPVNGARDGALSGASFATAGGVAYYDDPMSRVFGLDAKTSGLRAWFGYTSGSTALLGLLMAFASVLAWTRALHAHEEAASAAEFDVQKEEAPPPPPPEEPKSEAPPEAPPPRAVPRDLPPPAPAPAQAAKVLTQEPDPNEPVDLTANTIVQGNAEAYAGGFTASNGKNANAVRALPSPTGVVGGTGPVQAAGPDRSRTASLGGGSEWSCPFPPEADTSQMDEAYVTLQVDVRADGSAAAVRVVKDPGSGFGREARRCALARHYATALDHDGNSIPGATKAFRVHFSR